jgi:hypothetical protein
MHASSAKVATTLTNSGTLAGFSAWFWNPARRLLTSQRFERAFGGADRGQGAAGTG